MTAQSDLKSAQKRIESLHQALDMQEGGEESGEEGSDGERDVGRRLSSASSDSSYKIGQSRPIKGRTKQAASSSDEELSKKLSNSLNRSRPKRFSDEEPATGGVSSKPTGNDKGRGEGRLSLRDKDPAGGKDGGGTLERKKMKVKYADDDDDDWTKKSYLKESGARTGRRGLYGVVDDDPKALARHHVASSYMSDEGSRPEDMVHPRKHSADDLLSDKRRGSLPSDEDLGAPPRRARNDSTSRDKKADDADVLPSEVRGGRAKKSPASPRHSDSGEDAAPPTRKGHAKTLSFGKVDDVIDDLKRTRSKQKAANDDEDNKPPVRQPSKGVGDGVGEDAKRQPARQSSKPLDVDTFEDSKKPLSSRQPSKPHDDSCDDNDDVTDDSKKPPAKQKSKSLVDDDEDDDEDLELLRRRSRVKEYLSKLDLDSDEGDKADRKVALDASEKRDTPPSEQTTQDSKPSAEPPARTVQSKDSMMQGEGADGGNDAAAKDEGMSFQEKQHMVAMRRRRHRKRTIESEQHVPLGLSNEEPSSPVNGHS